LNGINFLIKEYFLILWAETNLNRDTALFDESESTLMKLPIYVILISFILMGCQKNDGKIYLPRELSAQEDLNQGVKTTALSITKLVDEEGDNQSKGEVFGVKFGDTTVQIQTNKADLKSATGQFGFAQFINTQKSSLLVQVADASGLTAPFYLLTLNNGKLDVISLYRPSNGKEDSRFTKGLTKIGLSGYLINNDYYVTPLSAKVYLIKRQTPNERIQGLYFINSPDKKTVVFLVGSSFYEVHYPSGETFTQLLAATAPSEPEELYKWIQENYSWQQHGKGISFLKANIEDNRVRNFSEFK
jgi:hypothetical protein